MNYLRCDGQLATNVDGSILCSDWVIVSETELLSATPIQQLYELLNEAFSTPEALDIAAAFSAAFMTPMVLYLSAWAFSRVISFINQKD